MPLGAIAHPVPTPSGLQTLAPRELGADRLAALEEDLRRMTPAGFFRLDAPGWFGNV